MTPHEALYTAIDPALGLLPQAMNSARARILLLAIALQESRLQQRRQLVGNPPRPIGPAKSYWQAEQGGGMVHGVRVHPATRQHAAMLYAARGVPAADRAIWDAIEHDDVLAAGLARLLLWTDPGALPSASDTEGAWACYLRTWRPGKPHRATWGALHARAVAAVVEGAR